MSVITILLYTIILVTALPIGLLLAWLCKDELVSGKRWFKIILYSLIVILIVGLLVWRDLPVTLSLAYLIIVTFVSLYKGKDKNFIK